MYCRNCGNLLGEGQKFCPACGTQQIEETNTNNVAQQTQSVQQEQPAPQPVQQPQLTQPSQPVVNNTTPVVNNPIPNNMNNTTTPNKKKSNPTVIIFIILGVFVGLIVLLLIGIFGIIGIISDSSNKFVCTSKKGNITLMYNDEEILGYTASGITYDLDQQKEYSKQVGVEAYLEEFNDWFEKNTSGTCVKEGAQDVTSTHDNEKENKENVKTTEDGMVIGDKKYGYITVPKNWVKFYDVDGTTALQYSYAGVYIVSMDYIREDTTHTAKEYAQSYLAQKKKDPSVSGVKGSTVKIGRNKEYTAYQVYMYFQSDGTYLVTYWFESEDGIIRYLALEGPTELSGTKITDYLHIPESFSLNK